MREERVQKARKLIAEMIARDHSEDKGKAVVEEGQGNGGVEEGQIRFQFCTQARQGD